MLARFKDCTYLIVITGWLIDSTRGITPVCHGVVIREADNAVRESRHADLIDFMEQSLDHLGSPGNRWHKRL
jgi:hypothetical protein